jgi:heme A synthase
VGPFVFTKDFFTILIKTGMGSGAIGVALIGLLGGYAFSGFGARWTRWLAGFLTALLTIASVFPAYFAKWESLASPSTGKVFGMLQFVFLMVLLTAGVSAPSRKARK